MIPKIIHFCWFGGNPKSPLIMKCMDSWSRFCPDWTIMEWNEQNFDVNICDYVREAYEARKFAFVSDYARLYALVNYGGIYLDTDCELLKPIDAFLVHEAVSGFEKPTIIPTALMGCRKDYPLFSELLERYHSRHFLQPDGSFDMTANVYDITAALSDSGFVPNNKLQTVRGFTLYPQEWFCPFDWSTKKMEALTDNTHAIHYFDGSWLPKSTKLKDSIMRKLPAPLRNALRGAKRSLKGG
ncbi:MAG: glycosyl transferase [Oscillospiraceae bacterium]|jgi:mannosyltransferase OCH1-like enzyme|nr:glycosyl transferase [Oscillospiraceae bacterium]